MHGTAICPVTVFPTAIALLIFTDILSTVSAEWGTAVCTEQQTREQCHFPLLGRTWPPLPQSLNLLPNLLLYQRRVSILKNHLLILRGRQPLLELIRLGVGFEVDRVAQIFLIFQNVGNRAVRPVIRCFRVVVPLFPCPAECQRTRCGDFFLGQDICYPNRPQPLCGQIKHQLDYPGCLRIGNKLATFALNIAIRRVAAYPLPGHTFHSLDRPLLL